MLELLCHLDVPPKAWENDQEINRQNQSSRCSVKNFAEFTGEHLYQSFTFNKVANRDLQLNYIKKEALAHVLSFEFC